MKKEPTTSTTEADALQSYFQTSNDHYNEYTLSIYRQAIEKDLFSDHETPLRLFAEGMALILAEFEKPVHAVEELLKLIDNATLEDQQRDFILDWLSTYVSRSEFDEGDLSTFLSVFRSHIKRLKVEVEEEKPVPVLTTDLRSFLKDLINREMQSLPEILAGMKPKERLNYLLKLMPYALPRVTSVYFREGES